MRTGSFPEVMLPPPEDDDLAFEEERVRDPHIHQKGH